MYMYTVYPYSVCILMCAMFADCLCILGMNSIYLYYPPIPLVKFSLLGEWGGGGCESPLTSRNLLILLPPKKFSPVDSPHQSFIPCLSTKSQLPPLNNNFQDNPITTALLAVIIVPFPFVF